MIFRLGFEEDVWMVHLTETAAEKLKAIMEDKKLANYALRVFVQGGGCGGMQYGMTFDNRLRDGDEVYEARPVCSMLTARRSTM